MLLFMTAGVIVFGTETALADETEAGFVTAQVSVSSDLTLQVTARVPDPQGTPAVRFSRSGKAELVQGVADGELWSFEFGGIYSQFMADTITMELLDGDSVLKTGTYSIRQYFNELYSSSAAQLGIGDEEFANLKTMMADALEYGAAAQLISEHNTSDLANDLPWVATEKTQSFTVPETDREIIEKGTAADSIKAASLQLSRFVSLRFRVAADHADRLVLSSEGRSDAVYSLSETEGDVVLCSGLPVSDYSTVWTASLKDGEGNTYSSIKYSVNSYIAAKHDSEDAKLAALVRSLYNYEKAADSYTEVKDRSIAQTGGRAYASVAEAVYSAEPGATVDVLRDSTAGAPIVINKAVTINGNDHTILHGDFSGALILVGEGGDLTLGDGVHSITLDGALSAENEASAAILHVIAGSRLTGSKINLVNPRYSAFYVSGATADVTGLDIAGSGAASDAVYLSGTADVKITDLTIHSATRFGININAGSKLELHNASISNISTYNGIYVNGGTLTGGDVTVTNPKYNGIEVLNGGSATLDGYTVSGAPRNGALVTKGLFDVKNADISGNTQHGIDVEKDGELKIADSVIKSNALNGIFVKGGKVTGSDVTVESSTYDGLSAEGGNISIEGFTLTNNRRNGIKMYSNAVAEISGLILTNTTTEHGVYVLGGAQLTLNTANITGTKLNPVFVENGKLLGGGITVKSVVHGLAISGGNVDIDGYTITEAGGQGVNIYNNSTVKIANLTVSKAATHGINLTAGSSLELNTASISNITTYNGIYVDGGTLTGGGVTVTNPKYNGIEVLNNGSATLDGYTASGAPRNGALVTKGTFDVKNVNISGCSYHGIDVAAAGTLRIETATINGNSLNAINNAGTITGSDITMSSLPYYGINSGAGTITINGLNITGATRHAMSINGTAYADITNAQINGTGWEGIGLYDTGSIVLTDSSILNWKTAPIKNAGSGYYTFTNVTTE